MTGPHDDPTRIGVDVVAPPVGHGLRRGDAVGPYRIDAEVGRGGMGVVYRAEHVHLGRVVALKVLAPHLAEDAGFRDRFVRESRIAASLQHPNIVTVYDAGEAGGIVYLAMQLVPGRDLSSILAEGPLEPAAGVDLLAQVAGALDTAHAAGLVHRDVKPGNVLVAGDRAYLTDFGLTKHVSSRTGVTRTGHVVGTTEYLAPEQVEGRPVDARTDVYALACLLHACLVGRPPFVRDSDIAVMYAHVQAPPPSLHEARPELPSALDAVVARGLAKRPEDRPPSCSALLEDARRALGGTGAAAATDSPQVTVVAPPAVRALVRASLGSAGFAVTDAPEDADLLDVVRQGAPDLLIADVRPGRGPGPDVFRALRAFSATRTLALVPRREDALGAALLDAGATAWLPTPFSALQLTARVREALGGEA